MTKKPRTLPRLELVGFAALLLLFVVAWITRWMNAPNRIILTQLHNKIALGAARAQVRDLARGTENPHLKLYDKQGDVWLIKMPAEIGATDWLLRIEYQDGRVTAVRTRSSDGPPPPGSPPDKQ